MTAPYRLPAATSGAPLHEWLSARVAMYLRRPAISIQPTVPLAEYGMDSVQALSLCGDLEEEFGLDVEPTLLWDYPTIESLLGYLTDALPDLPATAEEGVR
ncbi:acyl carrier protein [Streptomyces kaniharaensis]|uniref:Acyl carrier protein n=1 Tax=Streptomyces kaniharaensis TaxID=212423 RepID=A0A6N7KTE3_9ACTN|nr:acyl carrier protein [Streptomyces kaniharaensis]MQS14902.1 acyl carrier protein [Streptomyces kaniharaensis]